MKPGDEWRILRFALFLECLALLVYVSIPDYPYNQTLYMALVQDVNGWLHECFYIVVGFAVAIEWTFRVEERQLRITRKRKLRGG